MNINDIPVRVIGPGSQDVGDEPLAYMRMPGDMHTYRPPEIDGDGELLSMAGVRETMSWLRRALAAGGTTPVLANLGALDAESRDVVNQILGEGEVKVSYNGAFDARTQESVLAGVWRTFCFDDDGTVIADLIEVGSIPRQLTSNDGRNEPVDTSADGVSAEMTNALSILVELDAHIERYTKDGTTAVINLSLLPLSDDELEFLDARLGRGPADVLSRAYGKCRIISTKSPDVWWVRYYNSMNTLILNTLEVIDVPLAVRAAPEDLADSAVRLDEILAPYELHDA